MSAALVVVGVATAARRGAWAEMAASPSSALKEGTVVRTKLKNN